MEQNNAHSMHGGMHEIERRDREFHSWQTSSMCIRDGVRARAPEVKLAAC